ncbi:MAG: recombinase family protein [Gemmataceae bacterium]|nr:recombinase family protein [Gemmataceae bacterium]
MVTCIPLPVAYSYIRFSHPDQSEGDSLRRQTQDTEEWCQRNGIPLDTTRTLRDLGVSAFRGRHREGDKYCLAQFLKLVNQGRIARGSYLVIENLDRLSREEERPALRLWMDILDAGINIVQLHPETVFRHEKSDLMDIMRAIIELSRGHSESARKSERNGAAWKQRRKLTREKGATLTHRLPAWVEIRDGKRTAIPERAAVIKRIFALAASGYGCAGIVKKLTAEQVSPFAVSGHWSRTYVAMILKDRRVLGELQPRKTDRTPDGDPIPNYFPAVVTEREWQAASISSGAAQRRHRPTQKRPSGGPLGGRIGKHVNVFAGLLRDPLEDACEINTYYCATRSSAAYGTRWRVLLNTASAEGLAPTRSFPFQTFERAVLSMLREVDPSEILDGNQGPDEALMLSAELTRVETRIAKLEAELENGDIPALARRLRVEEDRRSELAGKLDVARQKAASPLSEAWGEAHSLIDALDKAPDPIDTRIRLRAVLRRIVDSIWLLPVARGRDRVCAVQLWFADGERQRGYMIVHRPPKSDGRGGATNGAWRVGALASVADSDTLDLRKLASARKLEARLAAVDVETLWSALRPRCQGGDPVVRPPSAPRT